MIHSAYPQLLLVVIIIFTRVVRPSKLFHKRRLKIMIATDGTVDLAEEIIDDTHVLFKSNFQCRNAFS